MPLPSHIAKPLAYLRKRYQVSERDLVALAKKLYNLEESEQSWEEIVHNYKKGRDARRSRNLGSH